MRTKILRLLAAGVFACALVLNAAEPLKVGEQAPDFTLKMLDGQSATLSAFTASNQVVLVVLRGWPGYQCPICERQVHDFVSAASNFADARARIIMVYPGPAEDLKAHAAEFLGNKDWPGDFVFVMDPDYSMVNAYGLRWDAPKETAYPSTFLLDRKGIVRFAKISHSHGDRTKAADVLKELKALSPE
jgi:peroxiredoxin